MGVGTDWVVGAGMGRGGMGDALGARMHPMAFLQKRGHLCAVARGREMFARVDVEMTPARFDILHLIHEQFIDVTSGLRAYMIEQARVPHLLGLRRQTVWKMVQRLVELGLITKTKARCGLDRRRNILALTEEGARRLRQAYGIAFSERVPLPEAAPKEGEVPRYWRRPELADVRRDIHGDVVPPKKEGREVAKIYTSFAWKRFSNRDPMKRYRYLAFLDEMMMTSRSLAQALGDRSALIYPMRHPEFTGPAKCIREANRIANEPTRRGMCEVMGRFFRTSKSPPTLEHVPSGRCRERRLPRRKCRWPSKARLPIREGGACPDCSELRLVRT